MKAQTKVRKIENAYNLLVMENPTKSKAELHDWVMSNWCSFLNTALST